MHVKYWAPINSYPIGKVVQNIIHVYMQNIEPLCNDFHFPMHKCLKTIFDEKSPFIFKSLLRWGSIYYGKKDTNCKGVKRITVVIYFGKKEKIRSVIN